MADIGLVLFMINTLPLYIIPSCMNLCVLFLTLFEYTLSNAWFFCVQGLMEKVKSQPDTSLAEVQNHSSVKGTEK